MRFIPIALVALAACAGQPATDPGPAEDAAVGVDVGSPDSGAVGDASGDSGTADAPAAKLCASVACDSAKDTVCAVQACDSGR